MLAPLELYDGYVFDMDGTVHLGGRLLPGAGEALAFLKQHARVIYLTNKPLWLPDHYAAELTAMGVPTQPEDVVSSTDSLLRWLRLEAPGAKVFAIAEVPLLGALWAAGHELTEDPDEIEVVVVSFDRTFDYHKLQVAFDAVRAGARIVATNPDAYCPMPGGAGLPDCAGMLAALEATTGARAEAIVGKPSPHMAATLLDRLGVPPERALMCGDRLNTDVGMAQEAGMAGALTLTGATTLDEALASDIHPTYIVHGLGDLIPAAAAVGAQ